MHKWTKLKSLKYNNNVILKLLYKYYLCFFAKFCVWIWWMENSNLKWYVFSISCSFYFNHCGILLSLFVILLRQKYWVYFCLVLYCLSRYKKLLRFNLKVVLRFKSSFAMAVLSISIKYVVLYGNVYRVFFLKFEYTQISNMWVITANVNSIKIFSLLFGHEMLYSIKLCKLSKHEKICSSICCVNARKHFNYFDFIIENYFRELLSLRISNIYFIYFPYS